MSWRDLGRPNDPAGSSSAQIQQVGETVLYGPDGKALDFTQQDRLGFSPGMPMEPAIGQRGYPPWEWERPVGWNLMWTPRGESTAKGTSKSFVELRSLAQWCVEARIAIEIQKKKLRGLEWTFAPVDEGLSRLERKKFSDAITAAKEWWRRPNKVDDVNFSAWLGQAVEEMYVTDALVFYKQRTFGGKLDSLVQLDGSTIKIDVDSFGHVLQYRQILYGRPTTAYGNRDLSYVVFNPRIDQVYGTSPLEEIAPLVQTAIKRMLGHLAYYTEGNIPMATLGVPAEWPVKRIKEIQTYLDETFSGEDRLRHKIRAIPMTPGNRSGGVLQQLRPFEFTQAEHEALLKLIHVHFGVSASQVAAASGLGSGGVASSQADEAADVGQKPLRKFLAEWITEVTQNDLGIEGVKFVWDDGQTANELPNTQSRVLKVQAGLLTVDEARAEEGREPMQQAATAEEAAPQPLQPAQASALQSIVTDVAAGKIPPEAAVSLIILSIPTVSEQAARAMVEPAAAMKAENDAKPKDNVVPFPGGRKQEPEEEPVDEEEEPEAPAKAPRPVAKANPYHHVDGRFASEDRPGGPVATARLAALPETEDRRLALPFPEADPRQVEAARTVIERMGDDAFRAKQILATPEEVPVSGLLAMQPGVDRHKLEHFVSHPADAADPQRTPVVLRHQGRLLVHDGHHRIAAEALRGVKRVQARVLDLDAPVREELAKWRRFATNPDRIRKRRWADPFTAAAIPAEVAADIEADLAAADSEDDVREVFRKYSEDQPRDQYGRFAEAEGGWNAVRRGIKERQDISDPNHMEKAGLKPHQVKKIEKELHKYVDGKFRELNRQLAKEAAAGVPPNGAAQRIATFHAATKPVTGVVLYRGSAIDGKLFSSLRKGSEIVPPAFWSTSSSETQARKFVSGGGSSTHRVFYTIEKSHTAVPMGRYGLIHEREHIFMPGTRFRVESVSEDPNQYGVKHIRLTEVTSKEGMKGYKSAATKAKKAARKAK